MRIFLVVLLCFLFLEIFFRFHNDVDLMAKYKKVHCAVENDLFLCPNQKYTFKRFDNSYWTLTTNPYGERITSRTKNFTEHLEEIWFIGDSISFGYLVDDEFSVPFLLDKELITPVRNLGVDSLGTNGILRRLQQSLDIHKTVHIKTLLWIYNTSDFLDDEKELRLSDSIFYKNLYSAHYYLGRNFHLYNSIFWFKKKVFQKQISEIPEIQTQIPEEHITFSNIKRLIEFINQSSRIQKFVVIIYPGMNIKTKKPDIDSKVTEKVFLFFKNNQIPVLDVRKAFSLSNKSLYFEFDGHPNEEGYKIIQTSLIDFLMQKQSRQNRDFLRSLL